MPSLAARPIPHTYAKVIRDLQRKVGTLEARLKRRDDMLRTMRGVAPRKGVEVRCDECGAEVGEPCVTMSGEPTTTHHLRGRTTPCGYMKCSVCVPRFMDQDRSE